MRTSFSALLAIPTEQTIKQNTYHGEIFRNDFLESKSVKTIHEKRLLEHLLQEELQ